MQPNVITDRRQQNHVRTVCCVVVSYWDCSPIVCLPLSVFLNLIDRCVLLRELFSPAQKYQLLVYHADAIFHDKEYRNAACKYSMALQQKKVLSKTSKVRTSTGGAASNIQAQVRAVHVASF